MPVSPPHRPKRARALDASKFEYYMHIHTLFSNTRTFLIDQMMHRHRRDDEYIDYRYYEIVPSPAPAAAADANFGMIALAVRK